MADKFKIQESIMWWIVSLTALILLAVEAGMVTFVLMVALNGFPSLPDAFAIIYLIFTGGLIPVLSLLDRFLSKKLSEANSLPLWFTGTVTITVSVVMMPILLIGLTVVLLLAFGMI
jgi:hypothetical protein